jgi:predicted nucleotidyltransferase
MRAERFLDESRIDEMEARLKRIQHEQELEEVMAHFEKYGHLFYVDQESGEILRDNTTGKPIKYKFGQSMQELAAREKVKANTEINLKLSLEDSKHRPQLAEPTKPKQIERGVIDAEEYEEIFGEKPSE